MVNKFYYIGHHEIVWAACIYEPLNVYTWLLWQGPKRVQNQLGLGVDWGNTLCHHLLVFAVSAGWISSLHEDCTRHQQWHRQWGIHLNSFYISKSLMFTISPSFRSFIPFLMMNSRHTHFVANLHNAIQCLEAKHATAADVYMYWLAIVAQLSDLMAKPSCKYGTVVKERVRAIVNFQFSQLIDTIPFQLFAGSRYLRIWFFASLSHPCILKLWSIIFNYWYLYTCLMKLGVMQSISLRSSRFVFLTTSKGVMYTNLSSGCLHHTKFNSFPYQQHLSNSTNFQR